MTANTFDRLRSAGSISRFRHRRPLALMWSLYGPLLLFALAVGLYGWALVTFARRAWL